MAESDDLAICTACGTQFDVISLEACRICDDPRQFVPASGQSWTSLADMRGRYKNKWRQDDVEKRMWYIWTEPKFAIGQRCILLETSSGNVLWDCVTHLDDETIDFIKSRGGLKIIIISHPHYYTTHVEWARIFNCPVYVGADDQEWFSRSDTTGHRKLIHKTEEEILPGVTAAKPGGHFPGSLVLCWEKKLLIADTFVTVPSAYYHVNRLPGTTSFSFMWSIPNMIPLPPSELLKMWQAVKSLNFESTHGAFMGTEVHDKNLKYRVLESMKIQARNEGYNQHAVLEEQ